MKTMRQAGLLAAALFLFAAAGGARADEPPPCDKNHYILKHPCEVKWTAASEGLIDKDARVVAVDPVQLTTLYAAGSFGVFKSLDEGRSWKPTGFVRGVLTQSLQVGGRRITSFVAAITVSHVLVDPRNPQTIYVATAYEGACSWQHKRFYKSSDGGESWYNPVLAYFINGCEYVTALVLAPSDPSTIYLANFDHFEDMGGTYSPVVRSTDGAATWDKLGYPILSVLAVDPRDPRTVYGGTYDFEPPFFTSPLNGVLKSRDGGVTWAATGLAGSGITALAVDPGEPRTIYAALGGTTTNTYGFRGLRKSLDGGVVWTDAGRGLEALYDSPSPVTSILVDTDDPGIVYLGTASNGVFRSIDGGSTWETLNEGLPTLGIHSLALVPGQPNTLYAGTPLGVFRIVDFPPSADAP